MPIDFRATLNQRRKDFNAEMQRLADQAVKDFMAAGMSEEEAVEHVAGLRAGNRPTLRSVSALLRSKLSEQSESGVTYGEEMVDRMIHEGMNDPRVAKLLIEIAEGGDDKTTGSPIQVQIIQDPDSRKTEESDGTDIDSADPSDGVTDTGQEFVQPQ